MKNLFIGIVIGLFTFTSALSGYLYSANLADARTNRSGAQETCPDTDGWVKIESSEFTEIPGATAYCFKAGPYVTHEYPEEGFGNSGGCSEENISQCGLSHWSYKLVSCLNPEGTIHEHYDWGLHQIVGGGLLWGSDTVYSLGNGDYLQCYCGEIGNGIQTYWWQIDLTSLEGWYNENGLQWNLGDLNFLAQNTEYNCSR